LPYLTDGWGDLQDGHDTVEWLAKSDWCNGKVATLGASATGITQILLAPTAPAHLSCQWIEVAPPSLYQYAIFPGGQFRKEQVEGWLKSQKRDPIIADWLHGQRCYNDFWKNFNALDQAARVRTPQLHVGGWYDIFLQGTLDAFSAVQANSDASVRGKHKLIIGPWGHRFRYAKTFGDFDPPPNGSSPPYAIAFHDWFDFHLNGQENIVSVAPPVQYYVMGPFDGTISSGNEWRSAHKWPPSSTYANLYLTQDQRLCDQPQDAHHAVDVLFDPDNPVPTIGGRNLFLADGPKDLRPIESRQDVLTFTTSELAHDTEVTGRVYAKIFAKNFLKDRDICCKLSDVYPDGKSILIAEGVAHVTPTASDAGLSKCITVDLWSTSMVFAKNHKIRLTISGSSFPAFDTSLQKASPSEKIPARCFSILCGGKEASFLSLPIVISTVVQNANPIAFTKSSTSNSGNAL
jgi:putative CocE/NonD family hydrolase